MATNTINPLTARARFATGKALPYHIGINGIENVRPDLSLDRDYRDLAIAMAEKPTESTVICPTGKSIKATTLNGTLEVTVSRRGGKEGVFLRGKPITPELAREIIKSL